MSHPVQARLKLRDRLVRGLGIPVRIPGGRPSGHDLHVRVAGEALHVRSERTELALSPEALGSAFLLPTAALGRRLSGGAIDPAWLSGAQRILGQTHDWWGWPAVAPRFEPAGPGRAAAGVGLAFSLGVDSFYSCFFAEPAPDLLILAGGFDVALDRQDVLAAMCGSVADVAAATGKRWTMIETDLRQHRLYRRTDWNLTHGGAVAFLGHLLAGQIGTLIISSSYDFDHLAPWGSHPALDPLWSSGRLAIRHVGNETGRADKLLRLVQHPVAAPLVKRHLRVCWRNPGAKGNCGRCEKCVRTRTSLHRDAPGFRLDTMPEDVPLAEAIESLPPIKREPPLNFFRELRGCPDPRVEAALLDLIRRSEAWLAK